jgi:hypothetical protein
MIKINLLKTMVKYIKKIEMTQEHYFKILISSVCIVLQYILFAMFKI